MNNRNLFQLSLKMATMLGLVLVFLQTSTALASPIYLFGGPDNKLVQVRDVYVSGSLYNVTFVDATGDQIYDIRSYFTFKSLSAATQATLVLLDDILLDGIYPARNLATDPETLYGITSTNLAEILTPFALYETADHRWFVKASVFENKVSGWDDAVSTLTIESNANTSSSPTQVYAYWNKVPEPSSIALFSLGLVGLGLIRRKHKLSA